MDEAKPTWYTAVPTMHQAIVARARGNAEIIARHPLRFMRSSSSSLPPQVITELEAAFGAPVDRGLRHDRGDAPDGIEPAAAGRAQARHASASPAGPEVAIMGSDGRSARPRRDRRDRHPRRQRHGGLREQRQGRTPRPSRNGWFRTGDQGIMDADGYLTITGRLKEIINRGGEKVSPREVDEILMDHPAVAQVVTLRHAARQARRGGRRGRRAARRQRRHRARAAGLRRASAPPTTRCRRRSCFMDEIPKGATGKLQRIGLAAKLGLG